MFVNYAHRGASAYYPENTLSAFYAGVNMGANGIETDIHITKDDILVLFHDDELSRVTDRKGSISDYTLAELSTMRVFNPDHTHMDRITTFEDFLRLFGYRDLTFAIELKQDYVEKETIDLLEKYQLRDKVILTSFNFDNIRRAKEYNPDYKVGYLYIDDPNAYEKLCSIGGEELCPESKIVTQEFVAKYHALGISVRPWGIYNEKIMRDMYNYGVNGMTVNFPDKLQEYIRTKASGTVCF